MNIEEKVSWNISLDHEEKLISISFGLSEDRSSTLLNQMAHLAVEYSTTSKVIEMVCNNVDLSTKEKVYCIYVLESVYDGLKEAGILSPLTPKETIQVDRP